jgi:Phage integrase, N-terminal SAM-like domain
LHQFRAQRFKSIWLDLGSWNRPVMADPSVADLVRSFELHLRAENKAGRTIETYLDALRLAAQFLSERGVELERARREDVEVFIADQLARWKPATAANRYRSLRVFYGWLEAEEEIPVSPMAKMRPPAVPDQPVLWCARMPSAGCWRPAPAGTSRLAATRP